MSMTSTFSGPRDNYSVPMGTMTGAGSPPRVPVLENHVERINQGTNELEQLADRFHVLADRLVGPRPAASTKVADAVQATPSHAVGRLSSALEYSAYVRLKLADALDRLESL